MKIYFDTCGLNRPLDDKTQLRIALEAEAVLAVLSLCNSGTSRLVSSEILELETSRNQNSQRRTYIFETLAMAGERILVTDEIRNRAKELEKFGLKTFDALHLACAEVGEVDYFCTCDDRFLRKAKSLKQLKLKVVSPLELAEGILI